MLNIIFCRINACLSLQIQSSVQHIWYTEYHSFHVSWLIPLKDSEVLLNKYNKKKVGSVQAIQFETALTHLCIYWLTC